MSNISSKGPARPAAAEATRRPWISRLVLAGGVLLLAAGLTALGVWNLQHAEAPPAGGPPEWAGAPGTWPAYDGPPPTWPQKDRWYGLALDLHNPDMPEGFYRKYVDEIAEVGCNAVCFKISGSQENKHSVAVYMDVRRILPADRLARLVAHAHDRGLKVMLLPIVLPTDPIDNEWRGEFLPGEGRKWDAWFLSYTAFIHHWAKFAVAHGVEMLSVGSELIQSEAQSELWRRLVRTTRGIVKDKVLLTYSANWDHYQHVGFWDLLDVIGMTTYYTLSEHGNPTVAQLKDRWVGIRKTILDFAAARGKPIFFTEVGWCSLDGATVEPWNYYRDAKINLQEQANAYQAFLETWQQTPAMAGVIFWEWTTNDGGPEDRGYSPKNKPAGKLLADWLARHAAEPATRTADP